jgi:glucose/arabinose dehydrogenase
MVSLYGTTYHFGTRIVFLRQGYMFFTIVTAASKRIPADQQSQCTVMRATRRADSGGQPLVIERCPARDLVVTPPNNPGMALIPDGRLWATNTAQGGDEINRILKGKLWMALVTHGVNNNAAYLAETPGRMLAR